MLIDYLKSKSDRGIIKIDMGQELRNLRDTGTYSGKFTGEVIDAGHRMPDFMAIYLQTKKLVDNFTGEEHLVADGLARGPEQTEAFDEMMKFYKRDRDFKILSIELSEASVIKRLLARGRNDDTVEGIQNRLGWYKTDVLPQLEFLKKRGREVLLIDGEPDPETIHKSILKALNLA